MSVRGDPSASIGAARDDAVLDRDLTPDGLRATPCRVVGPSAIVDGDTTPFLAFIGRLLRWRCLLNRRQRRDLTRLILTWLILTWLILTWLILRGRRDVRRRRGSLDRTSRRRPFIRTLGEICRDWRCFFLFV